MSSRLVRGIALASMLILAACGSAGGSDPASVARSAMAAVQAKDMTALENLACEKSKADIREQFDPSGSLSQLLPGVDAQQVLAAITIDTSKVTIGDAQIQGNEATVKLGGSMSMSFDVEKLKPLMKAALEAQGMPADDATIDAALGMLGSVGAQDIPTDEDLTLVNEGGAWKICE